MPGDIRSVETVELEDYRVRYTEDDEGGWEAAVVVYNKKGMTGKHWRKIESAPRVHGDRKWPTIGEAVRAFIDSMSDDSGGGGDDS